MDAAQHLTTPGRLLVVDDEENILRSVKRVLRRTGWEIETAPDGERGLEAVERFKPEVVVSDFRMPGMTGVEFLAAVKDLSPLTQRIMLTGQADQSGIEDAINRSEIFRFVSKPWNDAQLVLTIKSAFEQRALLLENERLLKLTQAQNEELRALNASLEARVADRTRMISAAKREWELTFDTITHPVAVISKPDMRVLRANKAFAAAAGREINEIAGLPICHHFIFRQDHRCKGCPVTERQQLPASGEIEHGDRLFKVDSYPMPDDDRVIVSYRDITDEKKLTQRMIETEKMAAVGQLAGGVAHEINNPLGGILAFSQLMQRDEGRNEQDMEALQLMEESALRCKRIVESLLKFSRRGAPEDRAPTSLNRTVEDTALLFKAQMKGSPRAVLKLELDPHVSIIDGNGAQLGQVLFSLLHNALYALPNQEGTLTVSTGVSGDRVFFRVKDTGSGIDPKDLPHIFEPSFSTKPPGEGAGLGLSIAYRIVEDHKGEFAVETAPGAGSTFTVFLPRELT